MNAEDYEYIGNQIVSPTHACKRCGAVVWFTDVHDAWHDDLAAGERVRTPN